MTLDSNKVLVAAPQAEIVEFLKDANNLYLILPQDSISDFKATKEDCSFKVQGGITISLIHDGNDGLDKLYMKSGEKSPFPFRLTIQTTVEGTGTEGFIHFDGEVNMFLKMMVEKPLSNLFNYMTKKLQEHFAKLL
ncbi:MAG: carbon monoxide dehydrogenase subunit G [Flavobacteriaceae bacterium]|jgi:carbon monoxide dehydrogenase subunit G